MCGWKGVCTDSYEPSYIRVLLRQTNIEKVVVIVKKTIIFEKFIKQAGGELCQAQVKLEVIVYVVQEGWS